MKYFIVIFGCQMNTSDAERIAAVFESCGATRAKSMDEAGIIAVTMCSVRQMAADRVRGFEDKFKQYRKIRPGLITILTGCVIKNDKPKFASFFDHILDIKDLAGWPKIIGLNECLCGGDDLAEADANEYFSIVPNWRNRWSVGVPISQGCDNFCSYCVVPYTRGRLVCRSWRQIVNETEAAVKNGAKEIWLLGQNVNNYHSEGVNFAGLLKMVNQIPGDFWVRFTSPHPKDFSDEAILAMAQCEKVTPYLNLPVQAGDDYVLKAMKRPYTIEMYKKLVAKLRQAFCANREGMEAELAISTDVIAGFCGETRAQFENTLKLFREIKYDMAYIAQYSVRPGTEAEKMADDVGSQEKKKRVEEINEILKSTALEHNQIYMDKTVDVLAGWVWQKEKIFGLGKTRTYKTVKFEIDKQLAKNILGRFARVRINQVQSFGLIGEIVDRSG